MKIYKKWWFWVIIVLVVVAILGGNKTETKYKTSYQWDYKTAIVEEDYKYIILGVENQDNDLEAGEYNIKTNDNSQASFMIYITDKVYEKTTDIPEPYFGMVQGFDKSELNVKLEKGQYLYIIQNPNGQGKVYVEKK